MGIPYFRWLLRICIERGGLKGGGDGGGGEGGGSAAGALWFVEEQAEEEMAVCEYALCKRRANYHAGSYGRLSPLTSQP